MRILVVEDNPADVYLLREALSLEGKQVDLTVVIDGEQALKYVQRKGEFEDASHPRPGGSRFESAEKRWWRCTSLYPERRRLCRRTVVVLTSSDSPRDRKTIESLGADRFITKPSDLDEFMALGRTLIGFLGMSKAGV